MHNLRWPVVKYKQPAVGMGMFFCLDLSIKQSLSILLTSQMICWNSLPELLIIVIFFSTISRPDANSCILTNDASFTPSESSQVNVFGGQHMFTLPMMAPWRYESLRAVLDAVSFSQKVLISKR